MVELAPDWVSGKLQINFPIFFVGGSIRYVRYPMLYITPNIKRNIIIERVILFPSIFRMICSPTGDQMVLELFFLRPVRENFFHDLFLEKQKVVTSENVPKE